MSVPVAAADIFTVKVLCYCNNQLGLNTYYWVVTSLTGTWTYSNLAVNFDTVLGPLYRPMLSAAASYNATHVQRIYPLPLTVVADWVASAGVGTGGSSVLPTQVCGVLSIQTNFAGRAYRGRRYIPFPATAFQSATGLPTAAYETLLGNLAGVVCSTNTFTTGANSVTVAPVLFHKALPASPTPIVDGFGTVKFGTQRRRGSYGRANVVPT